MSEPKDFNDAEVEEFMRNLAEHAREDIIPKMRGSAFCLSLLTPDGVDPYLALQVGVALLLEKPLIIIAVAGAWVPERVRRLADYVVTGPSITDPATQEALRSAIEGTMQKVKRQ